jgi:hypothetical protein
MADFARERPTGAPFRLPCVQELKLSCVSVLSDDWRGSFVECFPLLLALELQLCYVPMLICIPTAFAALHTLRLRDCPLLDDGIPAPQDPAAKPLSLWSFRTPAHLFHILCEPFFGARLLPDTSHISEGSCRGSSYRVAISSQRTH